MNMHHNHVATCLCCKHLYTDYERDYSDQTPGAGLQLYCTKNHFDTRRNGSIDIDDQHDEYQRAATCPDFEAKD